MILDLEERAFRAWPAEQVQVLDGWRLRYNRGVTRRASSVWPNRCDQALSLDRRIEAVEAFYGERGAEALYQITSVAQPLDLDQTLASRGYRHEAPVAVEIARPEDACATMAPGLGVRLEGRVPARWFEISAVQGRFAAVADTYRALLDRLDGRALYALGELDGAPAAVGLGVTDGEWLGVFSMHTLAPYRRRGLGAAILAELANAARARGLTGLYLQVEVENEAARALYRKAGFRESYRYHYRRAPAVTSSGRSS
jgi:ribosomal protein S18 acetylase RimI-like enzyme